jgi:hypothetical protein
VTWLPAGKVCREPHYKQEWTQSLATAQRAGEECAPDIRLLRRERMCSLRITLIFEKNYCPTLRQRVASGDIACHRLGAPPKGNPGARAITTGEPAVESNVLRSA